MLEFLMELNQTYCINVVSRSNTSHYDGYSFVVVEKFNPDSSQHFQNYYKRLLTFNQCGDWFQNLDYAQIEIGKIVLAQIDRKMNLWARGIISKCESNILYPEVYLIDSQRFMDSNELRICPSKFAQLILPTYNIRVNLCLDNDGLQSGTLIDMLINKNQYGELYFYFTPKSIENGIYCGELTVNNQNDDSIVSLKKLLKNVHRKKYFQEISKQRQRNISVFDPFNFKYLQNIFLPRDPNSVIFFDKNLIASYSDLKGMSNSLEHSVFDSPDDSLLSSSSTIDYSESSSPSNDSVLEVQNPQINCTSPIVEQKTYSSSFNSSILDCSAELNSMIDRLYESIIRGDKRHQESTVLETTADHVDENKSNDIITTDMDAVATSACFETENNISGVVFEIEQDGIVDQKIGTHFSEGKQFANISMSMKQQFDDCLPKLSTSKGAQCKLNNNFDNFTTIQKKIPTNQSIIEGKVEPIKMSMDDSHIWWSSDDES